jgi:hypothetical protein
MACESPHPQRGQDSVDLHQDLVVIGKAGTEEWARCKRCGAWFWLSTDLGGKWDYVAGTQLDAALGHRAFVEHDPNALLRLLTANDLPQGPIWDDLARRELLHTLLPKAKDEALRDALVQAKPSGRWEQTLEAFEEAIAAKLAATAAAPFPFAFDLSLAGYHFSGSFELDESLVLLGAHADFTALRIDRAGQPTQLSLGATPRYLAHDSQRVLFAVAAEGGEQVVALHSNGQLAILPPDPVRYLVSSLDDGWWLFFPDSGEQVRFLEWHEPGIRASARLLVSFGDNKYPNRPRRFAEGWLVNNAVDQDGTTRAFSLFDAAWAFVAQSSGISGGRGILATAGGCFWANTEGGPDRLERWEQRRERLERTLSLDARSPIQIDDSIIAAHSDGPIIAHALDGTPRWTTPRESEGATYLTAASGRVVAYDNERAQILDAQDGRILAKFSVDGVDLCQTRSGTVYLRSHTALWIIAPGQPILRTRFVEEATLLATAGENALLRDDKGLVTVVGPDGASIGSFLAPEAHFSFATRRGPYVVEIGRIRF